MFRSYLDRNAAPFSPAAVSPRFSLPQIRSIYGFPSASASSSASQLCIGIISLGGGLVGCHSPTGGVITDPTADCFVHWQRMGIPQSQWPTVAIIPVDGAVIPTTITPDDADSTENTLDVETVGALCPTANLTILLFVAPNTVAGFANAFKAAMQIRTVNGQTCRPSVISCSWGAPEAMLGNSNIDVINVVLQQAANAGITVTAATGDAGSSNGLPGANADFPSSSPYVLACGGTTLVCPNYVYDSQTVETAWRLGGGGVSRYFGAPAWQSALGKPRRSTPDIVMNADPNTGILYTFCGAQQYMGGTSIVAPAMAAFLALVNVQQFATPLLYSFPSRNFNDITTGSNGDYQAAAGYDHCTGLGSIRGANLAASFAPAPSPAPAPAPAPAPIPTTLTITTSHSQVGVGANLQIAAAVNPPQSITWASNKPSIASVSGSGLITGRSPGTASITATTASGLQKTITITVQAVRISTNSITLFVGGATRISASVVPGGSNIVWSSSNPGVATVSNGSITAKNPGITTISVQLMLCPTATASCTVNVLPIPPRRLPFYRRF